MKFTVNPSAWPAPPAALCLQARDVHVWRAEQTDDADIELYSSWLDSDEKARARRFKFAADRNRFVFSRGLLRQLLGLYTDQSPGEIAFTYGPFGKPSMADRSIHFNLSHTDRLSLFVFSASAEVGIDVEVIDTSRDWQTTARRFFHPDEWALLQGQSPSSVAQMGYRIWTCKESYLKVLGKGVGGGLETFDASAPASVEDQSWHKLATDSKHCASVCLLEVGNGFAAALTVLGQPGRLQTWNWRCEKELIQAAEF